MAARAPVDDATRRELFGDSSDSDSAAGVPAAPAAGSSTSGDAAGDAAGAGTGAGAGADAGAGGDVGAGGGDAVLDGTRSKENGPMAFHDGTEAAMLAAVTSHVAPGDLHAAIAFIDEFCTKRHWMMNLGDEKGALYTAAVKECGSRAGLELGMYCGYSCLRALAAMGDGSTMVCVDPGRETNAIAKQLYAHVGVADRVRVMEGVLADQLPALEADGLVFDHVFIDHEKAAYHADLLLLEKSSVLKPGTMMFADNVVVFHIDDYLARANDAALYRDQRLHKTRLEYTDDSDAMEDGVHIAFWRGTPAASGEDTA